MMNVGTPDQAFAFSRLPNAGVGLARLEFIINNQIGVHPKALLEFDRLDEPLRSKINDAIGAYRTPREFFLTPGCGGSCDHCCRLCATPGDRAHVGLQVQRVRQPARR